MSIIKLDLRDLTPAIAAAAVRNGSCEYSTPCIIGSLMTPEQRTACDTFEMEASTVPYPIAALIQKGIVSFPANQISLVTWLQRSFDSPGRGTSYANALKAALKLPKRKKTND